MRDNQQLEQYGVIGDPVAHSLSPQIHQAFAAQCEEQLVYDKFHVTAEAFADFLTRFIEDGGLGLNVTVPHKGAAFKAMDDLDEHAAHALAVNTIVRTSGEAEGEIRLRGYNTDGVGLIRDLTERVGVAIEGARVLVLGAGGAARGVMLPLLQQRPRSIVVANRTLGRAQDLVAQNSKYAPACELAASSYEDLSRASIDTPDLVINATSLGLQGEVPPISSALVAQAVCYDMSYGASAEFFRWAGANRALRSVDGLGMLVEQAAESFRIWRGVRPGTDQVFALLAKQIG